MDFTQALAAAQAEALKVLGSNATKDDVTKATLAIAAGQYGISLEMPSKQLVPFLDSPQMSWPRETIPTGNRKDYYRITAVSVTGKSTAAEGVVGNGATFTTDQQYATFGIISSGLFDVTYEAEKAGGTFDDLLARATTNALLLGRRNEAAHLIGGNVTALGACTTIAASDNGASPVSTLANVAYYFNVKALTAMAVQKARLAGAIVTPATTTKVFHPVKKAVVDQTDGYGVEGSEANVTPTATHCVLLSWDPNPAAFGYAVFMGTSSGITNLKCIGVTGQTSILIDAVPISGCSAGVSGDNSADALDFPGWVATINASGSGAYIKNIGAALSAAVGNGIPEIDDALQTVWGQAPGIDNLDLVMAGEMRPAISRKLGAGSSTTLVRLNMPVGPENTFAGGTFANKYVHPITGRLLDMKVDPTMCPGQILGIPKEIPYPMAEVPAPQKVWLSYEWVNFAYAITAPVKRYENRMRGGLAVYLPPACFELYNIFN